eukprot:325455_1
MANGNLSSTENFILSGIAAVGAKTTAAPLERIKLLIQNQKEMIKSQRISKAYASPIDCLRTIIYEEGVLSLWRGNVANCLRYLPSQALNFMFKEDIKKRFNISTQDSTLRKLSKNTASGGIAGTLSLTLVYSLDFTRTRLANDVLTAGKGRQFTGLLDVYRQTYKTDGFVGLHRGYVICCYTVFIYRGLYFGMYDTLKPILFTDHETNTHFIGSFVLGFGITTVTGVIVYPLDTVRRRMMMRSGESVKYKGSVDCFKCILKTEGVQSMYRGCLVNIFRNVSGAGTLVGFDLMKTYYKTYKK